MYMKLTPKKKNAHKLTLIFVMFELKFYEKSYQLILSIRKHFKGLDGLFLDDRLIKLVRNNPKIKVEKLLTITTNGNFSFEVLLKITIVLILLF